MKENSSEYKNGQRVEVDYGGTWFVGNVADSAPKPKWWEKFLGLKPIVVSVDSNDPHFNPNWGHSEMHVYQGSGRIRSIKP